MTYEFKKLMEEKIADYQSIIEEANLTPDEKKRCTVNWAKFIWLMECLTRRSQIRFNILNLTTIIGGILLPVVIMFPIPDNCLNIVICNKIIAAALGIVVSVSTGINQSYKFNDKWRHFRNMSENLKIEGESFFSLSGEYSRFSTCTGEACQIFMTNLRRLKSTQIVDYMRKTADMRDKLKDTNNDTKK